MKKIDIDFDACEVSIEEVEGKIVITASRDGEVIEEMTVDCEEASTEAEEGENDLEGEELPIGDESSEEEEDDSDIEEEMTENVKNFSDFFKGK